MTKKELCEQIKDIPDDAELFIRTFDDDGTSEDFSITGMDIVKNYVVGEEEISWLIYFY